MPCDKKIVGRLDLADVQRILELELLSGAFICRLEIQPTTAWVLFVLWFFVFFLPALCIIATFVYFFPRKVRRSVLSWLNSLSHSPGQTAKQTEDRHLDYPVHWLGGSIE